MKKNKCKKGTISTHIKHIEFATKPSPICSERDRTIYLDFASIFKSDVLLSELSKKLQMNITPDMIILTNIPTRTLGINFLIDRNDGFLR